MRVTLRLLEEIKNQKLGENKLFKYTLLLFLNDVHSIIRILEDRDAFRAKKRLGQISTFLQVARGPWRLRALTNSAWCGWMITNNLKHFFLNQFVFVKVDWRAKMCAITYIGCYCGWCRAAFPREKSGYGLRYLTWFCDNKSRHFRYRPGAVWQERVLVKFKRYAV